MANLYSLLSAKLENLRRAPEGGFTARCPACAAQGGDNTTKSHLRIWPNGAFRCAKVAKDTDEPIDHNRYIRGVIYKDANPDLLAELSVEVIDPDPKLETDKIFPEEMLTKLLPDYRYWVGRGISEEVLIKMQGGVAPADEKSKLSGRYVFPVRDDKNRIIGWTARLVSDASFGPKWKHLVKSSRCIFPIHVAGEPIRTSRKVVLLESPGDYLTCANAGMWNCIVLLGLNINSKVLGFLVSVNPTHIIISTNNDAIGKPESANAGNKAANKLRDKLSTFFGDDRISIRLPQTAKDWNAANPDEVKAFKAEVDAL